MPSYNFRLTDDLTVPIQAANQEDALKILKAEIAKREASPAFDQFYFDYEKGLKNKKTTFFIRHSRRTRSSR